MPDNWTPKRLYLIPIVSKTLDVLELLESVKHPFTLEEIHKRTRISKTTVFRILRTLVHRGYVSRPEDGNYRLVSRPRKLRFGFGAQSEDLPFSNAVTKSLESAALSAGIDLVVLDNKYSGEVARRNVEEFVKNRVDLVIEFQSDRQVAPIIANRLTEAGIPLISVDIPHPNAIYFGVDNYRSGMSAGELLADFAAEKWGGEVDLVLGLDLLKAGTLVQSRITGAFEAIRAKLPSLTSEEIFVRMDSQGLRAEGYKATLKILRKYLQAKQILIAAVNDTSALGAIDAARELKRDRHIAITSHDCIPEAMTEMARKNSPLIGSVSHQVETYGPRLIHLALALIKGESVSPYNYVEHKLTTV